MKTAMLRKIAVGLFAFAAIAPTAAIAADYSSWGLHYFNDGAGSCGYISCGPDGCIVIDEFPCPREVGGD